MPRKKIRIVPLTRNFQKYGLPLYSADWVWYKLPDPDPDPDPSTSDEVSSAKSKSAQKSYIVLAGGGGEGRSGIPNAVLLVEFDFTAKSLSNLPVIQFLIILISISIFRFWNLFIRLHRFRAFVEFEELVSNCN